MNQYLFHYQPLFNPELKNPEDDELKGRFESTSLAAFGDHLKQFLLEEIKKTFKERISFLAEKQDQNPLEKELDLHESFVENRTRLYIGRTELIRKLASYVESNSRNILVVYGEPGSGKSALLANFYRNYKFDQDGNEIRPDVLFIPHFIGASPGSTALYNLFIRFCEGLFNTSLKIEMDQKLAQIKERRGRGEDTNKQIEAIQKEYEIPLDIDKLPETFESFINKTTQKTIILIDGLNQLDESNDALNLRWLPSTIPENVKIIVSTLPGKTEETLKRKTNEYIRVTPLTIDEQKEIIRGIPTLYAKILDKNFVDILLKRKETANPLYLKVAMEELRIFGSFENLEKKINSFPPDITSLFVSVINRLENENGKEVVEKVFCLLECSRYGLTQNELAELLEEDSDRIHIAILRQIRDYLFNREELIDFFHRSLSKAVRKKFFEETEVTNEG